MAHISRPDFKRQIQQMDAMRFERFVADIWAAQGWETQLTPRSGDRGIDIEVTRESERRLIQVKRYGSGSTVGTPDIRRYAALRLEEEDVDTIIIVTSNRFSEPAEELAPTVNVEAIDGDTLYDIIVSDELYSVVSEYLDFPQVSTRSQSSPSSMSNDSQPQISEQKSNVQTIRQAITHELRIRMKYQSATGTRVREVEPYGIAMYGSRRYFAGYDHFRSETRYFMIERISWIQLTERQFMIPPDFDIDKYLEKHDPPGKSQCFIATSAMDSENAEELEILRGFRDNTLSKSLIGRVLIQCYYYVSPPIASWIERSEWRQATARLCLVYPVVCVLKRVENRHEQ